MPKPSGRGPPRIGESSIQGISRELRAGGSSGAFREASSAGHDFSLEGYRSPIRRTGQGKRTRRSKKFKEQSMGAATAMQAVRRPDVSGIPRSLGVSWRSTASLRFTFGSPPRVREGKSTRQRIAVAAGWACPFRRHARPSPQRTGDSVVDLDATEEHHTAPHRFEYGRRHALRPGRRAGS